MHTQWHNKKILKQHFTDARPINDVMCYLLGSVEGASLLEPSVGHGAFLSGLNGTPSLIDVVDIDQNALNIVKSKFQNFNIRTFNDDFIDIFVDSLMQSNHLIRNTFYDCIISNPPYGLYFEPSYRKRIKEALPGFYARESYGLFLAFSLSSLRPGGRYVFLLPDTFLSSINHLPLRKLLCAHGAPTHIIRFPSKFFETVNFGYGNLCIIAGRKQQLKESDSLEWVDLIKNQCPLSIEDISSSYKITGDKVIKNITTGWSAASFDSKVTLEQDWTCLGEIAECKTGIYTGDNTRFIGYDASRITRRFNGHAIDWESKLNSIELTKSEKENGIITSNNYVPIIRGGHRDVFDSTAWAIDWSPGAIAFYKSNKKARFQNSKFYFREGISVPMVTTKRISASLLNHSVFDQGVVGVFPYNLEEIPIILIYLNSTLASEKMKAIVNGSANNSANYLKRLPIPKFTRSDIIRASQLLDILRNSQNTSTNVFNDFVTSLILPN